MEIRYQATWYGPFKEDGRFSSINHSDYLTREEAEQAVEQNGIEGRIVQFIGTFNLPNCLPEIVWRSCACWTWRQGEEWKQVNIHGG